jgi:hypothetical protein
MPVQRSVFGVMIGVAVCAWILYGTTAFGQFSGRGGGRHGSGGKGHGSEQSDFTQGVPPPPPQLVLTPHGGEYISTEANYYEVVYMPLQTRIYFFDSKLKPLSARDVHAQMSVQLPMDSTARHVPFQYVAMPPGVAEQDYIVAVLDMRQLQDKETPITLEFSGLSDRRHPTASFTPRFSPSKMRPYVARVLPTEADREGVYRQRICPVSGAPLGSRGPVTKLYIADFPLYVAGDDCIAAVQEAPEKFLPQPSMPVASR